MRKIEACVTTRDIHNMLCANKWYGGEYIDRAQFHNVVNAVNTILADHMAQGHMIKLPCQMGYIELRKTPLNPYITKEGKLKIPYSPDWKATLDLWKVDAEAKANKTLIRRVQKYAFSFIYNKKRAKYNNKIFYKLNINRPVLRRMLRSTSNGEVDAFEMGKPKSFKS